jgi:hypothetical protein
MGNFVSDVCPHIISSCDWVMFHSLRRFGYDGVYVWPIIDGDSVDNHLRTRILIARLIAGIAAYQFYLVLPANADFLVSSQTNGAVMRYNELTNSVVGQFASVPTPTGIAVNDGYVYVNDLSYKYTYKFEETTGALDGLVGGSGQNPDGLTFGPSGEMIVGTVALPNRTVNTQFVAIAADRKLLDIVLISNC